MDGLPDVDGGEVGAHMRGFDWSTTDVGPPATWSQSLKSYVSMILEMPTPAIIFWGPNQTQLYNDGYAVIMGPRHPTYFAAPYRECWPETYDVIHPWMKSVLEGEVVRVTDQLVTLTRHGFDEEAYFTFTFSPLRDDDGSIAGIFQPVVEVTDRVLSERRGTTLRLLAAQVDAAGSIAVSPMEALSANALDVPFATVHLWNEATRELELTASCGLDGEAPPEALVSALRDVAQSTFDADTPRTIDDVEARIGRHVGHWPEPTRAAHVVPLRRGAIRGILIAGLSPRLSFDVGYREFIEAVGETLAATLSAERARRVEARLLERERAARRDAELQREHLISLLTQAPTPMVVLRGPQLVIELANPLACQVWQRAHADVIDRPILEALPELRGQVFPEMLERVYRTGVAEAGEEVAARLAPPGGEPYEVLFNFTYTPLRRSDGAVDGVLIIAFDVTDQVRARDQIDALRADAEAASRAKDEFFAILGHELRNPLAPILTAVELMEMRGAPEVEKERRVIDRQARHMVRLVDDLLDVSRIARGKIELAKEPVELAEVVARALEMARPLIEKRRHQLVLDAPRGFVVDGDPTRLAQAVANLLTNAAKYTEPGGRIDVEAGRDGDSVFVRVRDDGIGMDRDVVPHVFDAFMQERQGLDRSLGGLGLGLSIVRGIVRLHGGTVEVRSEGRGMGSELTIRLPGAVAVASVPAGAEAASPGASPRANGRRVLIVDDNEDGAELLGSWLRSAGHEVRIAHDGPAGLRLAQEHPPEVALLDIGLPAMDGYELARRLRDIPALEHVALIAVTGYGRASDRALAEEAGFAAHVVKPVNPRALDEVIRSLTS